MRLFRRQQPAAAAKGPRLHIGCGQEAIAGWVNIDIRKLPGVDHVLDVRQGLPFQNVEAIYAEHFLEHLPLEDGLALLRECRRALAPSGILRLSTPNLDWVFVTHYRFARWASAEERVQDCFLLNRAFYGWGHRFLYNRTTLEAALRASGFATVIFQRYGESDVEALRGLERHRTWEDTPDLPHVIIAEASGQAKAEPLPEKVLEEYREAIETR